MTILGLFGSRGSIPTKPARIDAVSDEYRGIAVVMPMFVDLGSAGKNRRST